MMRSVLLERLAIGCFVAVVLFCGLALVRPGFAWAAIAAAVAGVGLRQAAMVSRARGG